MLIKSYLGIVRREPYVTRLAYGVTRSEYGLEACDIRAYERGLVTLTYYLWFWSAKIHRGRSTCTWARPVYCCSTSAVISFAGGRTGGLAGLQKVKKRSTFSISLRCETCFHNSTARVLHKQHAAGGGGWDIVACPLDANPGEFDLTIKRGLGRVHPMGSDFSMLRVPAVHSGPSASC